jgi:hypothetical protein
MNHSQIGSEFGMLLPLSQFGTAVPNSGVRDRPRAISQAAAAVAGCHDTLAAVSPRVAGTEALLGDVAQLLGLPRHGAGTFSAGSVATPGKIVATPDGWACRRQVP